jgi:hypothetical protein
MEPGRLSPGLLPVIQLGRPDEGVYRTECKTVSASPVGRD